MLLKWEEKNDSFSLGSRNTIYEALLNCFFFSDAQYSEFPVFLYIYHISMQLANDLLLLL